MAAAQAQLPVPPGTEKARQADVPPRVRQAERFLAARGWALRTGKNPSQLSTLSSAAETLRSRSGDSVAAQVPSLGLAPSALRLRAASAAARMAAGTAQSPATAAWQPLGPAGVLTPNFGLVTGRITSLALDPSDATGNRLYVGTTGGGVWEAQNAAAAGASSIVFTPLTDSLAALAGAPGASISIGAVTVQPGGTGVILAGTGDPNDALDSYYGAGILRSTDGGTTWSLIQKTSDYEDALSSRDFSFVGEGFAGFAWSTANPQVVVAAVSQAYEGTQVAATVPSNSYEGLYYSNDAGATWHLATITDLNGEDVQGPLDAPTPPDGNAATAVVWNPVRKLFIAAVRYHGYYQSADGVTWTRLAAQPGTGLTNALCPTNQFQPGSTACPIFRGALAVNPQTGDTFAWTVDIANQDQGLWQDACAESGGACGNQAIAFAKQWSTSALEANTAAGAATIPNGDYNLALAAVPSQQDTLLLAGANDLWKCSLAMGCAWRNTTNSTTCMSAQVGEFQHALEWNRSNPLEIFIGNDSGLWRSTDAIGESGAACGATDASHFQNLNSGLGSLAEPESISQGALSPYTMLAGLGVNGSAGVKSTSGPTADWPQVLSGEGGPVQIDPANPANWYVNNQAGVSIHECSQAGDCTPADFGASAAVNDSDVGGDGYTMTAPAPFLVDALDDSQLLIGTCRVWRGPANGSGWSGANAISPMLDTGGTAGACGGDATIRSMAAMALAGNTEVIYVGMHGAQDGGANIPGHILRAVVNAGSTAMPAWQDLTLNPVTNSSMPFNYFGFGISSIYIDPHDATGNTVYATVEGMNSATVNVNTIYRSTDGGAHWTEISSNIPTAPANSIVVDPQDPNTVYVGTDTGVYFTTGVGTCGQAGSNCWSAFGTGLPESPVVALSITPASASPQALVAATYGRGIWMTPLSGVSASLTTAMASPAALTFPDQAVGTASSAQTVTLTNTGTVALTPTQITIGTGFGETDNCQGAAIPAGGSCGIQVFFSPVAAGPAPGQLTIGANVNGGQVTVSLSGTGIPAGAITVSPTSVNFGSVATGSTSAPLAVTVSNASSAAVPIGSVGISGPFGIAGNSCGASLAAQSSCQIQIDFTPSQPGAASGALTLNDGDGQQTVILQGTGASAATDTLSPASLSFPGTGVGQVSAGQTVQLTNSGDEPLTSIAASVSAGFQIASNNCTAQLAGHASCSIDVEFAPAQTGAQTGTLTVKDILRTQTISLSGSGLAAPVFSVSPSSLAFAQEQPGTLSAPQTVTVKNAGGAPMANVTLQISGGGAASFQVSATTCGAALNGGSTCTAQIAFNPAATGGIAATLTVSSSTLGVNPASVTLSGAAQLASGLSASPAQLDFAAVNPGQATPAQAVTVTNASNYSLASIAIAVSPPFVMTQNTCTGSLAAGAQCTAAVAFAPATNAGATGTLTVSSPSVAAPASVALIGSGGIQVGPASIAFPTTGVGTASTPTAVTVTNLSSTDALTGLSLGVTAGFQIVANTCETTLAPEASCTAGVEFAPAAGGRQTGSLTVTSSTVSAAPVALSGMGFDFTAAVSGSSSQTVASGQTANYALVLSAVNGSQGIVSFQCSSLPAHASCVFNPATAAVGGGAQGNVTVEISTGAAGAASAHAPGGPWRAAPLLACVLLLPLAGRRRRSLAMMAIMAAVVCFGAAACTSSGGSGGGGPAGGGSGGSTTAAGTYSIQIAASGAGVQHAVTVTLTVD